MDMIVRMELMNMLKKCSYSLDSLSWSSNDYFSGVQM